MRRRLFLTGPMGWGKSTAIAQALGSRSHLGGGFFTRRQVGPDGHAQSFYLESPDGAEKAVFLDVSQGKPVVHPEVFSQLGARLLQETTARFVILDEIGGIEVLCPAFMEALDQLWQRNIPCIGVIKGQAPAAALIRTLGLPEEYAKAAGNLRNFLENDPDTLVYSCSHFDETARNLAVQWCREYVYE